MTTRVHVIFSIAMTILVGASVVWGIAIVGSPTQARLQRFDQRRLAELRTIFREIQSLCHDPDIKDQLKRELPGTLDELAALARTERINLSDPETGERYVYVVTSETTYELCATFTTTRSSDTQVFWNHPEGKHCFTVDALDPP